MANKKLPGGRKSAGRVSTSAQKLVALKAGATGIAISELPAAQKLTGVERFPLVQDKETRGATVEQIKELIPAGETGASAYEVWSAAQPEGADKSEAAFLTFMEGKPGKDGENGTDGLSAYQIWADAQENGSDTSEAAYLAFQEGKPGLTGDNGASAYQVWATAQPDGADTSEEAYLESMVGKPGKDGENGADGLSAYQIWSEAQEEGADTSPEAYIAFQAGRDGKDGESAYQIWLDAGNEGSEDDFLEWLKANAEITLDPSAKNLIKSGTDGLLVDASHPIIPRVQTNTFRALLDSATKLPNDAYMYTATSSIKNPLGVASVGGVGITRFFHYEPEYYYLDATGNVVWYQVFFPIVTLTASTINFTMKVLMSSKPDRAYSLATGELVASVEDGDLQCPVSVQLVVGTTLGQNGMA